MKKIVIAGSASQEEKSKYWKSFWQNEGYLVTAYPEPILKETFERDYPRVHKEFFQNITEANVLFIMNEDKKGISGYIGAETFAELCFGVIQNSVYDKHIKTILLKMPSKEVQSFDEIELWLKLGWIEILEK